eukprot:5066351-Amphidinium_carterae.1
MHLPLAETISWPKIFIFNAKLYFERNSLVKFSGQSNEATGLRADEASMLSMHAKVRGPGHQASQT